MFATAARAGGLDKGNRSRGEEAALLGKVEAARETAQLTAVVVGTAFGARAHVPALQRAGYDVVALVGRDPERTARRAERAGVSLACTSLAEALRLAPDVVAVSTGPAEHYQISAEALDAGCHIVCEKPFTLNLAQAQDLDRRAAAADRIAYIAHEFRFVPSHALFARVLARGDIGEPRLATIIAHTNLVADPAGRAPDWWFDPARGGGWLGASGSHGIDLLRCWLGEFEAVSCRLCVTSDRTNVADDSFSMGFVMRSGVQGLFQSGAGAWGDACTVIRVGGSQGSVWIDDMSGSGNVEAARGPVMLADRAGTREVEVPPELMLDHSGLEGPAVHNIAPFARLYSLLGDAIRGTPPTAAPRPATFTDGVACMAVLDACRASSAQDGRWIAVGAPEPAPVAPGR